MGEKTYVILNLLDSSALWGPGLLYVPEDWFSFGFIFNSAAKSPVCEMRCPSSLQVSIKTQSTHDSSCIYKFLCSYRSSNLFLTIFPFRHKEEHIIFQNCPKFWNLESTIWDVTLYDNLRKREASAKYIVFCINIDFSLGYGPLLKALSSSLGIII